MFNFPESTKVVFKSTATCSGDAGGIFAAIKAACAESTIAQYNPSTQLNSDILLLAMCIGALCKAE